MLPPYRLMNRTANTVLLILLISFFNSACNNAETGKGADCIPDAVRCSGNRVERCLLSGQSWFVVKECGSEATCVEGLCLDDSCEPGVRLCAGDTVYQCAVSGDFWTRTVCPENTWCLFGECIECVNDQGCGDGMVCDQSSCVPSSVHIRTENLPEGTVGVPYNALLTADSGGTPYSWTIEGGELPPGLILDTETGTIEGTPSQYGDFAFTVVVTDAVSAEDRKDLAIRVRGSGISIMSPSTLPQAEEGVYWETQLHAAGGLLPYGWMITDGRLPAGLDLYSNGRIAGIPEEIGQFAFDARVFDNLEPPQYADKSFQLVVRIAPLRIVGDTEYEFYVTRIIVLDMIFPYFPYNEQLQAKGGLKPYLWEEKPVPVTLAMMLSISGVETDSWGIPEGLTLHPDGRITGTKTSVADAQTLTIPISNISVTGYFFYARVSDSQFPPHFQEAAFVIPTLPLSEP